MSCSASSDSRWWRRTICFRASRRFVSVALSFPVCSMLLRPLPSTSRLSTYRYILLRSYSSASEAQVQNPNAAVPLISGATGKPLPPPPPASTWAKAYKVSTMGGTGHRAYLFNSATALDVMKTYGLDDGGQPKTVIETYPGKLRPLKAFSDSDIGSLKVLAYCQELCLPFQGMS